jgi:hypothetical protein
MEIQSSTDIVVIEPRSSRSARHVLRRRILLCGLGLPFISTVAFGQFAPFYDGAANRQARLAMARNLKGGFDRTFAAIPNLSPADSAYVEREYRDALAASGGKYSQRLFHLLDGREFNIRESKRWASLAVLHSNTIVESEAVSWEVAQWARLALLLTDETDLGRLYQLRDLGVLDAKDLPIDPGSSTTRNLFLANMVLIGNVIVKNVISPYLEGKLP